MTVQSPQNRGRVQAQGLDTEESVAWPPPQEPPTKLEVLAMLDQLWGKLTRKEQDDREGCFEDARNWIESRPAGGVNARCLKTFLNRKIRGGVRVDIEILLGVACVDEQPLPDEFNHSFGEG